MKRLLFLIGFKSPRAEILRHDLIKPYRIGVGSMRRVSYPEIMEGTEEKVILFDGICGLCNAWVDFVLRRDRANTFKFATL
jgi:hypothetical protein